MIKALQPIQSGRKGNEVLLLRPHWRQLGPVKRELVGRAPWLSASRLLDPWAAILAKAELASDLVPYALRHSSIVRGLRAGLPIRLVAALHDASSAMIERHYALTSLTPWMSLRLALWCHSSRRHHPRSRQ